MSDKQPLYQQPPPPPYPQSAPPQNYGYNQPSHQTNNTVIVTQPTPTVYVRHYGSGDHFLALSIVMSFICFFCGSWLALFCTIPAIVVAINAQDAESRGDTITMEQNHRLALYLNVGAVVTYAVFWTLLIVAVVVTR